MKLAENISAGVMLLGAAYIVYAVFNDFDPARTIAGVALVWLSARIMNQWD
jgi:hypothetical protein